MIFACHGKATLDVSRDPMKRKSIPKFQSGTTSLSLKIQGDKRVIITFATVVTYTWSPIQILNQNPFGGGMTPN